MRNFITVLAVLSLTWPVVTSIPAVRGESQNVVINELLWMGSSLSSADEWIELRNMTGQPVDISGWSMTKKSGGQEATMLTIPNGRTIPANGFFLVANYPPTNANSTLTVMPDLVTTEVALSNSALQIKLYDVAHALIDTADDGVGNPLSGRYDSTQQQYASMERNPIPGDGSQSQSWHSASRSLGFKSSAIELGTPGTLNSNGVPRADAGPDRSGVVRETVNYDGSDSTDPEEQPLSYTWDFGDGSFSSEVTPGHVYTTAGAYIVTLTVNDGTDSAVDTITAVIVAAPAAATPPPPAPSSPPTVETSTSCYGLRLSELNPNPPGVDTEEFIELMNSSDEDVPVSGCSVWTNTTKKYTMSDAAVVPRSGFLVLPKARTKLTLNNGGTTVRLVDTDGTELDRATYGVAPEGQSWVSSAGTWAWTTKVTAGGANVLRKPPPTQPKKKLGALPTKKTIAPPAAVSLAGLQELDSGDRVLVEGVIVSPRDALGSTLVNIQSPDGGTIVSIPNGGTTVSVGQEIRIIGTVRLKRGRRYVAADAKGMTIVKTRSLAVLPMTPTDDVGVEQADQLIHIKGVVALASGSTIQVDDGSGPVNVYLKSSTGIVRPKVKAGDTMDVVGIVGVSTSGVRVLPRMANDLQVERVLGASTSASAPVITAPAASPRQTLWYWSFIGAGACIAAARPLWQYWKKKKATG